MDVKKIKELSEALNSVSLKIKDVKGNFDELLQNELHKMKADKVDSSRKQEFFAFSEGIRRIIFTDEENIDVDNKNNK